MNPNNRPNPFPTPATSLATVPLRAALRWACESLADFEAGDATAEDVRHACDRAAAAAKALATNRTEG